MITTRWFVLAASLALVACSTDEERYDLLIENGLIYDGSLAEPFVGDIAISGQRVVAVGDLSAEAGVTIDATGMVVAPGFVDVHNHSDNYFLDVDQVDPSQVPPEVRSYHNALYQGVTTVVTGNCGGGVTDTGKWFGLLEELGFGTNTAHLIPHGHIRAEELGETNQPTQLSQQQLDLLKSRVAKEMQQGAWGLSTGLAYMPGSNAAKEEIIELCKVVKQYGGLYATHMRDESGTVGTDGSYGVLEAIKEAIDIGRQSGVPVQISHLKLQVPFSGLGGEEMLKLIADARAEGLDVTVDAYPYDAGMAEVRILLPNAFKDPDGLGVKPEYTTGAGLDQLKAYVDMIFADLAPEKFEIKMCDDKPEYVGKTLKDLSDELGKSPTDCYIELLLLPKSAVALIHALSETAMMKFMPEAYVFSSSDGFVSMPAEAGHPRGFGAFTRKLTHVAVEKKVMSLQAAIRSMTSLPAKKFGLAGRGVIEKDAFADVVVLDLKTLADHSTYEKPGAYAEGVVHLLVNGVQVIADRKVTGRSGGSVIRRTQETGAD